MLFSNVGLELLSQFLFESGEIIFGRPKNLLGWKLWTENSGEHVCSLLPASKYFRRAKTCGSRPEFCALFDYGLRNVAIIFVED